MRSRHYRDCHGAKALESSPLTTFFECGLAIFGPASRGEPYRCYPDEPCAREALLIVGDVDNETLATDFSRILTQLRFDFGFQPEDRRRSRACKAKPYKWRAGRSCSRLRAGACMPQM